jgi:hypothetical protein
MSFLLRLDVINIGSWNGLIDYAKKAVRLTPSSGKELEYVAENLVTDKEASNIIMLNHLDATSTLDIRTISKFSDVFPEELLGMPPDCEIEFVIELVSVRFLFSRDHIEWSPIN